MKIYLFPQYHHERVYYIFENESITITLGDITETYDFEGLPDGELVFQEYGEYLIDTKFELFPILSAEKKEGVLYLELLNWIGEDASYEERFPEWIDAEEYVPPKEEEPDED